MAIKRYFSNADTTITNAYQEDLVTRGTGSNMGAADILEIFQIYGQVSGASGLESELSRVLIKFPVSDIITDRTAGTVPGAGSVNFYLRLYNAEHTKTTPSNFTLSVLPVSADWEEGIGMDMENYSDVTSGYLGSNWIQSAGSTAWSSTGGDYHASPESTVSFASGLENIEVDVTTLVEQWIAGTKSNYGFGIKLSSTDEESTTSVYTKKFFSRTSQFFHKRPTLEARWNSVRSDQRGDFYISSSMLPASENMNDLYLYNVVRGQLQDIPSIGTDPIYVNIYETLGEEHTTLTEYTPATGSHVSTGIYKVSICTTSSAATLYDVWFSSSVTQTDAITSTQFHTGTITPQTYSALNQQTSTEYLLNITNLRDEYNRAETARFRLYVRPKNWSPNVYTTAVSTPESVIIPTASYEVCREIDNFKVIPFGTGSLKHTGLSYDVNGSYFDLSMNMFEAGYSYKIKFAFYDPSVGSYIQQPNEFKFRVREDVY